MERDGEKRKGDGEGGEFGRRRKKVKRIKERSLIEFFTKNLRFREEFLSNLHLKIYRLEHILNRL